MSDLTRYELWHEIENEAPDGEWVKADEAEARIAELVMAGSLVEAKLKDAEARIKELEARLRAADELALAVEAHEFALKNRGSADPEPVRQALTAYREAAS